VSEEIIFRCTKCGHEENIKNVCHGDYWRLPTLAREKICNRCLKSFIKENIGIMVKKN